LAALKVSDVENIRLGRTVSITCLYLSSHVLLPLCGMGLVDVMVSLAMKQMQFKNVENQKRVTRYTQWYEWTLGGILISTAFLPFMTVFYPQDGCRLIQAGMTLNGIVFLISIFIPPYVINIVLGDIRQVLATSKGESARPGIDMLKALNTNLTALKSQFVGMNIVNSVTFIATGNAPFLLHKIFYIYPCLIISGIPMLLVLGVVATSSYSKKVPADSGSKDSNTNKEKKEKKAAMVAAANDDSGPGKTPKDVTALRTFQQ
jgi:hypothetical protein